jgi:DHA1 family chloramphenicol resistance protein-like MFS transporter
VATYVLALTIFCLGTSEFMLAGLLPGIAGDLGVSIPRASLLISGFAVGMLVGAPVMALLTLRLPRKVTLLGAGFVFAAMHVVGALTGDFALLMTTRVIAAVACATFWAVAAVTVLAVAPAGATARGLAVLVGGLTLANILGVPLGTWVGEQYGWQGAFVAVAVATFVAVGATAVWVPETGERGAGRSVGGARTGSLGDVVRREFRVLRNPRLWVALSTTVAFQAAVFGTFSYLAPMLTDVAGLGSDRVPMVLLLFGIGSFVGITIGGRFADRNMLLNVALSLGATMVALLMLRVVMPFGPVVAVAVFVFGAASFSITSAINGRIFQHAGDAPTMASAFNVSSFNVGNAVGPWLGGLVIAAGLGYLAPIWVSVGLATLALGLTALSWRLERVPGPRPEAPVDDAEPAVAAAEPERG